MSVEMLGMDAAAHGDRLHRFVFEQMAVRGELVRLDASFRGALQNASYPEPVARELGQSLAAALLMSATIKFEGSVTVQVQSNGALRGIVAQATHARTVRGLARWDEDALAALQASMPAEPDAALKPLTGADARLAITIQREGKHPYQAVVPLDEHNLAAALSHYFIQSEQLPTFFLFTADRQSAAGIMLQQLPGAAPASDDWERLKLLVETLTAEELRSLQAQQLLHRLFHEDDVRLFEEEPVAFRCGCSRSRVDDMLISLGKSEIEAALDEDGRLEVRCEFCNRAHEYDRVDLEALLRAAARVEASARLQ